jgi:WD40 repeat protein
MEEPTVFLAHDHFVNTLCFTADSQTLISAGMDNLIKLWSVPDWALVSTFIGHEKSVNSLSLSPDNTLLLTGSSDTNMILWSYPEGQVLHKWPKAAGSARFSPDGKYILSILKNRIRLWSVDTKGELFAIRRKTDAYASAFTADGKTVAIGGRGDEISLWSVPSGEATGTLTGHKDYVVSLALAPDGRTLASIGYEGTLRLWSTETWTEIARLGVEGKGTYPLTFAPDGQTIAVGTEHTVHLFSVDTRALTAKMGVKPKGVYGLGFSPDGRWLAMGAADKRIRIWERQ